MRFLDAMAQETKPQYKTQNHQHGNYENEDLCCFPHITHFFIINSLGMGLGFSELNLNSEMWGFCFYFCFFV